VLRAPVFHVNAISNSGLAVQLAVDYRQQFQQTCSSPLLLPEYGHNEATSPAFTQPRMHEVIRRRAAAPRSTRAAWPRRAQRRAADAADLRADERLDKELDRTRKQGARRSSSAMASV